MFSIRAHCFHVVITIWKWAERLEYSHMGSPRFQIEFVSIWGSTESWHFREFFGTSVLVVKTVWELLKRDSLLPEGDRPKHLLWALHFMKVYPKQSPGCLTVGASAGAVDPKTHRKWVWAFIDAVANLVDVVVSKITVTVWGWHGVVFFVMTPCDLADAPKWIRCPHTDPMLASGRKQNKMHRKKAHFFHTRPHPPHRLLRHRPRSSSREDWAHTMCSTTAR